MSQALGITRERDNNKDLTLAKSDLWLADDGFRPAVIVASPRIGITKAMERPLRFSVARNPYVSGKKIG
jgi:DNA-3-methyladenine glycosylase